MLRRFLLLLSFTTLSLGAFAQMGSIKGNVKDGVSGEAVVGANIYLLGSMQGGAADANGDFEIPKVKAGTYSVVVSFISYKSDTLKNITVYPDQTTVINTQLFEESQQLGDVVVTGGRILDTDVSVMTEIKKSDLVAVGISAQQISLSQDRDAAQIVRRLPGVTISGNRFINVRGLSERYSTVMLNGVIAPSSEVDSRAFSFDLIPSSMIDRMLVYKSGSAELSGDFAGAVINIDTKSVVEENSLSINVTGGIRVGTTFKDFYTEKGSSTDALGFDNGYRDLPSGFPTQNLREFSSDLSSYQNRQILSKAGASLNNNWSRNQTSAAPDLRTTINFSRVGYIGSKRVGNVTSLSYSNTRQHFSQQNYYYEGYDVSSQEKVGRRYVYNDERDVETVRLGLVSNFSIELNPSNKIQFRNLYNQQGNSAVTSRSGIEDVQNYDVNNLALNYFERSLYSGQLSGKHSLSNRLNLNWILGYSATNATQPDYRRIRSQRAEGSSEPFSVVIPPSASSFDAGRFYSDLSEKVYTHALNLEYKLNPDAAEEKQIKILTGYYLAQTERDFSARWFSYRWASTPDISVLTRPFQEIFTPQHLINNEDSQGTPALPLFILEEGTNVTDSYIGKNLLTSGYASVAVPINDFRLSAGARVEYNRQQLTSGTDHVDNPVTSVLPFMNLSYNFSEKSLIRLAYGKTVNRPVFRELAPFNFYDFDRNSNVVGAPGLKNADIHNLDLRFERYPSKAENLSFGVFYKYFQNPIETRLEQGSNLIYSYLNGKSATSYGAEVEIRKSLDGITASGFVNKLTVLFNGAYIHSEVTLPADAVNQDSKRAMQGQSPYVINSGLYYNDYETGWQVNVSYNVFGKRIFAVGDYDQQTGVAGNPTQYEMPRHQIDLTVSKEFGQHFEAKFGVQDILNQKYRLMQDSNSDRKITSFDDPIQLYKPGQYITLGFTYKL